MGQRKHQGCPDYEPDNSAVFGTCMRSGRAVHRWSRCEFPPEPLGPTLFGRDNDEHRTDEADSKDETL